MTDTDVTGTDVTTIRLPHTGLNVPDATLSVAAYRQHQTRDGVAFTASLRVSGRKVGTIENDGHGGPTSFFPDRPRDFGYTEIEGYAARCRTEEGDPVSVENLLDELVEEFDRARWLVKVTKAGQLALRKMDHTLVGDDDEPVAGFPPHPVEMFGCNKPTTEQQTRQLARQLMLAKYRPGKHGWWQMWNGQGWHDLTTRPAYLSKELYA